MQHKIFRQWSALSVCGLTALGLMLSAAPTLAAPIAAPTTTPKPAQITATAKAKVAQATQQAKSAAATATAEVSRKTIEALADFLPLDVRGIAAYPQKFTGQQVFFAGRIFNVVPGDTDLQMWVGNNDEPLYVTFRGGYSELYEKDSIIVYGTAAGTHCFTNTRGSEVCHPLIEDAIYFKKSFPEMKLAQATAAVLMAQATKEGISAQATAQAELVAAAKARAGGYGTLAWKELVTYPEKHAGEKIKVKGRVFNIVPGDGNALQMYIAGTTEVMIIFMEDELSGVFEGDNLTIYGTVADERYCFKNSLGGEVCQPRLDDAFYTKP